MRDPHTKEARGFGFVTFEQVDDAAKAVEELNGRELLGRAITVQVARRARARAPTPGQYLGPPKRDGRDSRDSRDGRDARGGFRGGRVRGYDRGYDRDRPRDDRRDDRPRATSPSRAPRSYDAAPN